MYVAPNTTLKLLKNVPLDSDYTDTLFFQGESYQRAHFLTSYISKTFDNLTYQRVGKGTLRIQVLADDIYDYNYMMFQNSAYGSKWFYAFINRVEYINDHCTEVFYEIDELQTWFFEMDLPSKCWIDRTHSETDEIGDSLTDEPVPVGDYVCNSYTPAENFGAYSVVIAIAEGSD